MAKKEKLRSKDRRIREKVLSSMTESERRAHLNEAERWSAGEARRIRASPTLDEIEKWQEAFGPEYQPVRIRPVEGRNGWEWKEYPFGSSMQGDV